MVESLAQIMSDFAGETNRVQCLAHIVNLVIKIILRQFNVSKRNKRTNIPSDSDVPNLENVSEPEINEAEVDEIIRVLDKEEKEMDDADEADDEENGTIMRDVEMIEEMMEEVKEMTKMAKPVQQVLYKVATASFFFHPLASGLLFFLISYSFTSPSYLFLIFLIFSYSFTSPSQLYETVV